MLGFWRRFSEVAWALGFIVLGTLIVHSALCWWSAPAVLHQPLATPILLGLEPDPTTVMHVFTHPFDYIVRGVLIA